MKNLRLYFGKRKRFFKYRKNMEVTIYYAPT